MNRLRADMGVIDSVSQDDPRRLEFNRLHVWSTRAEGTILFGAAIGAFLAGWFLSPIFHVGSINAAITWQTVLLTLAGSIILLAVLNLFRRGRRA